MSTANWAVFSSPDIDEVFTSPQSRRILPGLSSRQLMNQYQGKRVEEYLSRVADNFNNRIQAQLL
jgi:hypothetical protein